MNDYKEITLRDIYNYIMGDPKQFPNGLDTKIMSGDFEGNYCHRKHEIQYDGNKVFLGYEMHEGWGC